MKITAKDHVYSTTSSNTHHIWNDGTKANLLANNKIFTFNGQWISGSPWERFGKYNSYVVIRKDGHVKIISAHSGELVPGSTEDLLIYLKQNQGCLQKPKSPFALELDPTYVCSSKDCGARCFSSAYRKESPGASIPTNTLKEIVVDFASNGGLILRLDGGGDPLCHPAVRNGEITELAYDLFLKSTILTSGDLLSKSNLQRIVRSNCYLRISLNAANSKTRRLFHGNSVELDNIFRAIEKYANLRNIENPDLPIGSTYLLDLINYREVADCAKRARESGINHFSVRRILGPSNLRSNFNEYQIKEIDEFFKKTMELSSEEFKVFLPWRGVNEPDLNPSKQDFNAERCWQSTLKTVVEPDYKSRGYKIQLCGRYRGNGVGQKMQLPELYASTTGKDWISKWQNSFDTYLPSREMLLNTCVSCLDRGFILMIDELTNFLKDFPEGYSLYHLNNTSNRIK